MSLKRQACLRLALACAVCAFAVLTTGTALVQETRRRRDLWLSQRLAALTPAERATLIEAEKILRRLYN